ncbi:MAG: MarR family transcriptional regulator [Oxalobacter sp.]
MQLSWLTKQLVGNGQTGLISAFAAQFGVSRPFASRTIKSFIEEGWIEVKDSTKRPTYKIGENRLIHKAYQREEVEESIIWIQDFSPYFALPKNIEDIACYGFTEIANNAHGHSDGEQVQIVMATLGNFYLFIDDGVGIFKKIQQSLNLPDPRLSLLELSKGKFTTDAGNHSGEGIFFTSKMFDYFDIESNGLRYHHKTVGYSYPGTLQARYMGIHEHSNQQYKNCQTGF